MEHPRGSIQDRIERLLEVVDEFDSPFARPRVALRPWCGSKPMPVELRFELALSDEDRQLMAAMGIEP
jgi:hypothetical protein